MTAPDRVAKIPLHWIDFEYPAPVHRIADLIANSTEIIKAVEEAVAEEREACAKLAETHGDHIRDCDGGDDCWHNIARDIRRRGQP